MAVFQTGIQWASSSDLTAPENSGASEHVARSFVRWAKQLVQSMAQHKNDPATIEQRRRTGTEKYKHGLTADEEANRKQLKRARRHYYETMELQEQYDAAEQQRRRGASEHAPGYHASGRPIVPKSWEQMSDNEHWWLEQLWSGELKKRMRLAEQKCPRVQANDFRMEEPPPFLPQFLAQQSSWALGTGTPSKSSEIH